jgi:hypothetical protein
MPPLNRLGRLARLATLPETRGLLVAAARSTTLRTVVHRGVVDPGGLLRDLANPANARHLARSAVRHPAVAELANAGLVVLPVRYLPLGWAATWVTRRVLRRFVDPPVEVLEGSLIGAGPAPKNVTPEASETEQRREGPR